MWRTIGTNPAVRQKVYRAMEKLPAEGVEQFLDFLRFKYGVQKPRNVVALGGLRKELNLEVTDEDVRVLRQQVTVQVLERM